MANGDIALDAGMDIVAGEDDRRNGWDEINKTRDYIIEFGLPDVVPVANGGTGATGAAQARINLGVQNTVDAVSNASELGGNGTLVRRSPTSDRFNAGDPVNPQNVANKSYVDDRVGTRATESYVDSRVATRFPAIGGTMPGELAVNGNFYLRNSSAASSGYAVAYINGDGRVARGASSERYKKHISEVDPASLGDLFPDLHRFQMRGGDNTWKYGYIAERLDESDDLRPFVVFQTVTEHDEDTDTYTTRLAVDEAGNPIPDSIDFIALLITQNAQLKQQLELLTQRIDALEESDA